MYKSLSTFIWNLTTLTLLLSAFLYASPPLPKRLNIAIIQTIDHPALNSTRKGIIDELAAHGYKDNTLKLSYYDAQGKVMIAVASAKKAIQDQPNVIVAIGTVAAQVAKKAADPSGIPVIFASITDPVGAGLVNNLKKPAGKITGVSNFIPLLPQLDFFKELVPHIKTLGIIYNPGEDNSVAILKQLEGAAKKAGITLKTTTAMMSAQVPQATSTLIDKVDAIFISNDNTALAAFSAIAKICKNRHKPAFSSDGDLIKQGAYAVLGPDQYALGRQTGQLLLKVLSTQGPFPAVEFPHKVDRLHNQ